MKTLRIALLLFLGVQSSAQEMAYGSIDGIVKEVLSTISGEPGAVRDWDKFRDLFLPTTQITRLYHASDLNPLPYEIFSLEEYITFIEEEYSEMGYTQYELGKVVNEYNGITNVFQSYFGNDYDNVESMGIISYQLMYYNNRWWISNMLWTTDSNGVPITGIYLGS